MGESCIREFRYGLMIRVSSDIYKRREGSGRKNNWSLGKGFGLVLSWDRIALIREDFSWSSISFDVVCKDFFYCC